ncbi:MAG: amidase [Solirubrobacteraceae bacterium]|nr:amidase [Solirubrobacteraceae bacterium]
MPTDHHALLQRPAGELAALVSAGEISATELATAVLERIAAVDPRINAFTDVDEQGALQAAAAIHAGDDRPLAGVPIAVKNNRAVLGLPVRSGGRITDKLVAPYDHHTTARLRRAGAVIVGTTALPEWGLLPTTEPLHREPTRNPWDLERTAGGSSGGAAAAVAAGVLPLAHGNDGGGSIRIPAACTGLVGLKPQRGRVSQGPETGENYLVVDGALTRTVADTALALDVLAGPELGDATWAPPHTETYRDALTRDLRPLRIGVLADPGLQGVEVSAASLTALGEVLELLQTLGHEVVEPQLAFPVDGRAFSDLMVDLFTDMASTQPRILGAAGKAMAGGQGPMEEADLDPLAWAVAQRAAARNATDAWQTKFMADGLARIVVGAFSPYDVVLTPALVTPPVTIGTITAGLDDPLEVFRRAEEFMAFSPVANITGLPAISMPTHVIDGLPIGVQAVGRACEEHVLLQLAAQLERELHWEDRRSPIASEIPR